LLNPEEVRSVAVIKHGALGDLVLTRPFLLSVREYFPLAEITLSIAGNYTLGAPSDLAERTHVSVAASAPGESALTSYRSFAALGRHDILFDLTQSARSRWIAVLNPARLKVGFARPDMTLPLSRSIYDILVPRTDYKFEAETFLDQLAVLGCSPAWPPEFAIDRIPRGDGPPIVLYFPTASTPEKCWNVDGFIRLLAILSSEFRRFRHVVLGGIAEWERRIVDDIAAHSDACPDVEFRQGGPESFDLIRTAALMISNDTGMRNYAIAAGTPTLGIFFRSIPFRYHPRFGLHRVVFDPGGSMPAFETVLGESRRLLMEIGT
jgi:ADP-heptose:LPS heptosyltransferase